ncbi:MAG TPA: Crp/Fnr family transcriptional regulator [Saprospiraceae bacterium]|nr:Crp/Fnr family transcriptional regulator [Saprospiraceae bacterium]
MKETLYAYISQFPMLSKEEIQLIVDRTEIRAYKKGTYLLREGEIAKTCYLILKGCIRQFVLRDGVEITTAFYTEGMSVNSFTSASHQSKSNHYMICNEDCVVTINNQSIEDEMCQLIPRLESIIRDEVEKLSGHYQDTITQYLSSSPEERYLDILENRADLLNRVPQHQIASYIGITPESLSRIRKRLSDK